VGSNPPTEKFTRTSSPWDLLPAELQIDIFAQCGVRDLLLLRLVCHGFHETLTAHEQSIVRQYLRHRRHGTLPSTTERTFTRNPEDDVVLLSDLFPPVKSAKGGLLYTFRYLHSLRRRQEICSKLCYFLADRAMERFLRIEATFIKSRFPSKSERNIFFNQGVDSLRHHLTPMMYVAPRTHLALVLKDF
jgi:F-box domain